MAEGHARNELVVTDTPAKTTSVQLGHIRIEVVSGGRFKMDGGNVFGMVPKALWSRVRKPDEEDRVEQTTNCLFVDTGRNKILIDTGYGGKLTERQRRIFATQQGFPLTESLQQIGVAAEEIDTVVFSHLHFDHAGGATILDEDGQLRPTFANAQHVVQRREWMIATADLPELCGSYPQDNLLPLQSAGCLRLIDGNVEIVPGVRSISTGGHTPGHQAIQVGSGNDAAVYLGDLCLTTSHLPVRWGTSFDLNVLELRRKKSELLATIAEHNWLAFFDHDPHVTHARLRRDDERDFAIVPKPATENWVAKTRP